MDAHLTAEEKQRAESLRKRWIGYEMDLRFGSTNVETVKAAYADWLAVHETAMQRAFEAREGAKILRGIGVSVPRSSDP